MRRLPTVLVPLAAASALAVTACSSGRDGLGGPSAGAVTSMARRADIASVGVIGDSITVGAEPALRSRLEGLGLDVLAVDAANGRRIAVDGGVGSGVEAAARVAAVEPDLWVVALGTNDVANLDGPEAYATAIDTMLAEVPDDVPVVWVDIYFDGAEDASDTFNTVLRERLAQRGNATAVDWATVADDDGVLRDGVHPGADGNLVFAGRVADGVAAWLG